MNITSVKPGDIVKVDKKGRRFFARAGHIESGVLDIRPHERNVTYTTATSRQIVGVWHANKATRERLDV